MTMKLGRGAAAGLALAALCILPLGTAVSDGEGPAPRWTLELVLSVAGIYRVTDEAGPVAGNYSFTVRWQGTLERDDVDWRLTHGQCALEDWKAQEQPAPKSRGRVMTIEDFKDMPAFRFHYILQDKGRVMIDFGMDGFPIPLNPSRESFLLTLPASGKTTQPGPGVKYDDFVVDGSNLVQFGEGEFADAALEKEFAWTWRRNQSALEQDVTIHCYQSHKAQLTVRVRLGSDRDI